MTSYLSANTSVQEGEANTNTSITTAAANSATATTKDKTRDRDEKEESSTSTGSDGGKGNSSGSGSGGYNADCSSSDSSSNNDAATRIAQKQMTNLTIDSSSGGAQTGARQDTAVEKDSGGTSKTRTNAAASSTNAKNGTGTTAQSRSKSTGQSSGKRRTRHSNTSSSSHDQSNDFPIVSQSHNDNIIDSVVKEVSACLPQWNGIKMEHPMDPRIDLSTVGFTFGGSNNTPFFSNNSITINNNNDTPNAGSIKSVEGNQNAAPDKLDTSNGNNINIPSVEQYTKLLEVRFLAQSYGYEQNLLAHVLTSLICCFRHACNQTHRKQSVRPFFNAHGIDTQPNTNAMSIESSKESEEVAEMAQHTEIDATVGDILDTAKNKLAAAYATAAAAAAATPQEDEENDKDSSSMIVLARPKRKHSAKQEGTDSNSGRSSSSSEEEAQVQQQPLQQPPIQEAANDEDVAADENGGNNEAIGEGARQQPQEQQNLPVLPQRYGIATMVSEYSSSNRNTSGSGSGGNTGSGTGSGSNQGGSSGSGPSSGSGNDQGGISSNGNGSSGSGNDKGSSEEMMDHNGETNSTENSNGNSAETSPNSTNNKLNLHEDNTNTTRFSPNPSEPSTQRRNQNAAREKKLQDKKRKRMNMRRVYEDQMELDMGSSDSSFEQGALRPGKPVTLDNAIGFTKTAKLVVKVSPSLTVIHTNAAYSRLSGIDSHQAVGNPITSLLSRPRHQLSQLDCQKEDQSTNDRMNEIDEAAADSKSHATATSRDRNPEERLEKLIVASGHSRLNEINIRCKPHKMVGRNAKAFKSMLSVKRNQDEGSNGSSSITSSSYDGAYNFVACNMSISPVVSSPEIYNNPAMTNKDKKGEHHHNKVKRSEKDHDSHQQKAKRRKHHHTMNDIIHNRKRQVISHYLIQLEPIECDGAATRGSQSSLSTNVEARMLREQQVIPSTVNTGNQNVKDEKEAGASQKEVSAIV